MRPSLLLSFGLTLLSLGLTACTSGRIKLDDTGSSSGDGGGTVGDGGGGGTGIGDGGSENTAGDMFTALSSRIHPDYGSLAYVSWDQAEAATVHIEYSFDDGVWVQSPSKAQEAGTHEQILVGIPYEEIVSWRVVAEDGSHSGGFIDGPLFRTDDLPDGLPLGEVLTSEPDKWLPGGTYLLTSINQDTGGWTGGTYWRFIIDRQARVVWAAKAPERHWTLFDQVSVDGDHILWDEATYWSSYDDGAASVVHSTYLDEEIAVYPTPGLHHCFIEMPDHTLVWGSQDHGGGEALVERAPTADAGTEHIIWTCDANWPGAGRSCESNGLFWVSSTDTFLYSFYTNNSLVEVDHTTGDSQWWAGEVSDGYEFDPSNSQFSWQHGVSYTSAGTLLLSTEARVGTGHTTMVREYDVDHETGALHQVWSYDPGVYATTNGDAWRLTNGNTLHVVGSAGHVFEVDPDGNPVWHVTWHGTHLMGRGTLIDDLYTLVKP